MPTPPGWARRLLARALSGDPAAPAILGDLHEDFVGRARTRGLRSARRWYVREALFLASGRGTRRLLRFLSPVHDMRDDGSSRSSSPWLQDARYALRTLRRSRAFTLFTAGVIALGVGATTAVYSVLRPLMLAPLPFEEPQELVWIQNEAEPADQSSLSAVTSRSGNLRDFREQATRSFQGITGYNAFSDQSTWNLTGEGAPESLDAYQVAHDFLEVLGVRPLHGRGFTRAEGEAGGPRSVLLSHGFWERRFGGDASMVGRTLQLNREPYEVVGVLPPSFDFASFFAPGRTVDLLLPFPVGEATDRWGNTMFFVGRLQDGVPPTAAQAELDAVVAGLEEAQPDRWGLGAEVTPLQTRIAQPLEPALLLLLGAAATVLLIVAVNVTNLLLARAPRRSREMVVRKALGASRRRLARQLVLESVFTAALGSVAGVAVAWLATRWVASSTGLQIPLLHQVEVDPGAAGVGVSVALLTGLLVGAVPALRLREGGEAEALRAGGRGSSAGRGSRRLQEGLVVGEVALACGILVVGGLLLRSFQAVLEVDPGYESEGVVAWRINPSEQFESNEAVLEYFQAFPRAVAQMDEVEAVGVIDRLPLEGNRTWGFRVAGRAEEESEGLGLFPHIVDPGYLDAMGVGLLSGRGFTPDDGDGSPPVVLLNAAGARRLFREENPLGRHIITWSGVEREIVGVVEDVRHVSPELGPGIQVYFPLSQVPDFNTLSLAVRSSLPPEVLAERVGPVLAALDADLPTREWWTVESTVERATSPRRFTLRIVSAFALVALLLSGLGIYGVLAQSVAERRPEIGIRMALGATPSGVVGNVLGRTAVLVGGGGLLGAGLGLVSTRSVAPLLYGVEPADPVTFVAMVVCLGLVAGVASVVPAWRASRVPGVRALRSE